MPLGLSRRADFLVQSEIRNMSIECDRVGGINLSQGICDNPLPVQVREGANRAMLEGINSYTRYDGLAALRRSIARKLGAHSRIEADPEGEIVVSAGSTGAFYCTCLALLNAGDEVVIFEPYYGYHINTLLAAEAVPKYVSMKAPDWTFTREALEAAIGPRTRAIMVCTPSNPTGKVWTRAELELVGEVAGKHDLFIFTDEVYEYFVFDGAKHLSPAAMPELRERTIAMFSLSKTYSITGWRIGYSVADRRWSKMIGYMNDLVYVCAPAPLQMGVANGLDSLPETYYRQLCDEYQVKRDIICDALVRAGLTPYIPRGAYYVLADLSKLPGTTGKERAMALLERTKVACVPGESFYHSGPDRDRIGRFCFAKSDDELREAARRLENL